MRRTFCSCLPCCPGAISCRRSRSGSITSKRELKKRKARADCARKPNLIQWGNASRSLFDLTVNRWRSGSFQVVDGKLAELVPSEPKNNTSTQLEETSLT